MDQAMIDRVNKAAVWLISHNDHEYNDAQFGVIKSLTDEERVYLTACLLGQLKAYQDRAEELQNKLNDLK